MHTKGATYAHKRCNPYSLPAFLLALALCIAPFVPTKTQVGLLCFNTHNAKKVMSFLTYVLTFVFL